MKLLRYGPEGYEKPGLLGADGTIRDLSGVVGDVAGATLSDEGLARLRAAQTPDEVLATLHELAQAAAV